MNFRKGNEVTIGDRIRRIRKKRRLTQAELAMMSGLSLSAIQGYEQGRYEPKRKSLESIAEVFKIPVDELYDMPAQLFGKGNSMEELIKRLERVIQTGAPDKDGQHPITAEVVLEVVKGLSELSTNLAEVGTDAISRQQAIDAFNTNIDELVVSGKENVDAVERYLNRVIDEIKQLPPIQPKRGRWHYSDGKPARIGLSFGVVCDQCGTESEYCTNFCGECGADMRGEQDG